MIKKVAVISLIIVAAILAAGCTSSTNSNQAASSVSTTAPSAATKTANATTKAAASASAKPSASASIISPTPKPTLTPTPTPTPTPSPTIQVIISGPTTIHDGSGGKWTATVLVNGKALPQDQLTGKMNWFIDGHYAPGNHMDGSPSNSATFISDANGSETTWAPNGVHTLNAEYLGDLSLPNASITVTKVTP